MRNLVLWNSATVSLTEAEFSSSASNATAAATARIGEGSSATTITALALDLDNGALFLATESKSRPDDGEATVTVWRLPTTDEVRSNTRSFSAS